jgi:hypothetical protein
MRLISNAVACAAALMVCSTAQAAIIDFEDNVVPVGFNTVGDVISGGFLFDSPVDHAHLHISGDANVLTENGTNYYAADDFVGINPITMSLVGGGTFSLNSLDYAEFLQDNRVATSLTITGNLFGGGTVQQIVALDFIRDGLGGVNDFQTTVFDGSWANLVSVEFKGSGSTNGDDYFALDNIVVNQTAPVPEPTSMALLGIGAGITAVGAIRRRRQ